MVKRREFCADCGQILSDPVSKCPHCGRPFRKGLREAYGSPSGLGLFDLIPGVRDLPYGLRFTMMIATVLVVVTLLVAVTVPMFVAFVLK